MNLPNKLTILRIFLSFTFIVFLFLNIPFAKTIALALFFIASLTDFFDGYIARKYNMITNLGKLLDPIADKILTLSAFLSFVQLGLVKAWMVAVIILRELIITGLRLLALSSNGKVVEASLSGKHKTASQMAVIVLILIYLSLKEFIKKIPPGFMVGINIFMYITVMLTIISGISYLIKNKTYFYRDR